jgi:hypothetical protein
VKIDIVLRLFLIYFTHTGSHSQVVGLECQHTLGGATTPRKLRQNPALLHPAFSLWGPVFDFCSIELQDSKFAGILMAEGARMDKLRW